LIVAHAASTRVRQSTGEGGVEKGAAELVGFASYRRDGRGGGVKAGELLLENPDYFCLL
jgi:hypothetical protein